MIFHFTCTCGTVIATYKKIHSMDTRRGGHSLIKVTKRLLPGEVQLLKLLP